MDAALTPWQLVVPKDVVKKSQISADMIIVNSFALVRAVLQYCSSPIFEIPRLSWMFVQRLVLMGSCEEIVLLSLLVNKTPHRPSTGACRLYRYKLGNMERSAGYMKVCPSEKLWKLFCSFSKLKYYLIISILELQ